MPNNQFNNQGYQNGGMQNQYPPAQKSAGLSVASMVCGIVALVLSCCVPYLPFLLSLLAVIFGAVALKNKSGGKGMAITGLVCGIVGLIPAIFVAVSGAAIIGALGSL